MTRKPINTTLKLVLEMGPIVMFFVTYIRVKDRQFDMFGQTYEGFVVAAGAFIPVLLVSTGLLWWLTGKLSRMQLLTAILVIVFGGLSLWFNDERFFKMKPTFIYLVFSGILGVGLVRGKSYLRVVLDEVLSIDAEGWMRLTQRTCVFFLALALANEVVWRFMSTDTWVFFKTFVLSIGVFVFFMTQRPLLKRHWAKSDQS